MFFHFNTWTLLIILIHKVEANWRLIDQSFTGSNIHQNNWGMKDSCSDANYTSFQDSQCNQNQLMYVKLDRERKYLQKLFSYKSFQTQIIFDVLFDDADTSSSNFKVFYDSTKFSESDQQLYNRVYYKNDLIQNSAPICFSDWGNFEFYTVVSISELNKCIIQQQVLILIAPSNGYMVVGIRNLLIYVNTCHPTCLTCNGPAETECLSCFDNVYVQDGKCICIPYQQFSETYVGCRQECSREYSIARFDKICVNDNRIKPKFTLFENTHIPQSNQRYFPLIFVKDEFYPTNTDLIYENCNGISFIGKLQFNEGMLYQMSLENAVKFIRIRITFYLFNFQESSNIEILHNGQIQFRIIKDSQGFQVENLLKIFEKNQTCSSSYTLLRIEMTFQLFTPNPDLLIQGQLLSKNEFWGFNNVTVDTGFCQTNCLICSDFSTCTQCDTTYKLYQNKCVQSCPIHSSNCIDYEDIIPYSRYFAKGFYDFNMTLDEIKSFYDSATDPSFSQSTGQQFSFFIDKIVLGGLLVWNDGSYKKTWVIQKPHYAVTVYFNLTYGDGYTGTFSYKIGSDSSDIWQGPFSNPGGGSNLIGRIGYESTRHFNVSLTNFYTNNLYVEFKCDVDIANITKEFCAISEYFIVIHYCPPFCSSCSSLTNCLDSGYAGPNCGSNQYQDFNSTTETYSCKDCNQPGCNTCTRAEECTQCVSNQFYLTNGICLCNPFTFLQGNTCIQCNKYCENCYGNSQYNCLTCVKDYNRGIKQHQCSCLPGYYDDGINLPCLPICGDQIIVEEEDCDDGNNNPFDGCHYCQYSCDQFCHTCMNSLCLICQNGYQLIENKCVPLCQDGLLVFPEQCEDGNIAPFDGCYNCLFQCSMHCIDCQFGICKQCNKLSGWQRWKQQSIILYLQQDGSCKSICGDNIRVLENEECDNNNNNQCNKCQITCDINCLQYYKGVCIQCIQGYKWYQLIQKCVKVCENNVFVNSEKVCEDGNNQLNDGCYQCQFSCQKSCTLCTSNGCLECNNIGWQLDQLQNKCETICGDGITVQDYEECDDLIDQNCFQCKLSCQDICLICYKGDCLQCKEGWVINLDKKCYPFIGDSIVVGNEQCDDNNSVMYDGCYLSQYQCSKSCMICQFGECIKCQDGYYILEGKCLEILNDGQTTGNEQCDDMNLIAEDGCFNGQYDCPKDCDHCYQGQCIQCVLESNQLDPLNNQCISLCGDGYLSNYEQCDDANQIPYDGCYLCLFSCNYYCQTCDNGICRQCQFGYYLDISQNTCYSICGDGILTHDEQCDNGNVIFDQLCVNCKLQCQEECAICIDGNCFQCISQGWQLDDLNNYFLGNEQCDDGNDEDDDGCADCYFKHQEQCTLYEQGQCKECNVEGWELNINKCITICGDLLILGKEECDDGNLILYDGCNECKFSCQEQCVECQAGVCYDCIKPGWVLNQFHICITQCGDGFIVDPYEECEDGNDIPYDGCYLCQFQCSEGCIECKQQQCQQCNYLYQLDTQTGECLKQNYDDESIIENQLIQQTNLRCGENQMLIDHVCVRQCGNGILINQYEECDDGNNYGGDGCSNFCHIEDSYQCLIQQGSFSLCTYIVAPEINLNILSEKTKQTQIVELSFTQQVKLKETLNLEEIMAFTIIPQSRYQITISSIQNLTTTQNNPKYQIQIEFINPIQNPILQVDIQKNTIFNQYELTLKNNYKTVNLGTPFVLSETTKQQLISIVQLNDIMMYSMVGVSSLALITGNANIFFNLLELLQSLSYLRYMQCQFPPHLNYFLNTYTKVSMQPIFDYLQVDLLLDKLSGGSISSNQATNKIQQDQNDIFQQPYLFNAKSCYFSVFSSTLTYLIYCYLSSKNIEQFIFRFFQKHQQNLKIIKFINMFQRKIQKKCLKEKKEYFSTGIFKVYFAILHQFVFSAIVEFPYYKFDNLFTTFNSINAIFGLLLILISNLQFLQITTAKIKNKSKWKYFYDENKTEFWATQFKSFQIYRILLYILIIVKLINYPEAQSILLSIQSLLFLIYLIKFKPLKSLFDLSKLLCREFLLMMISGTFLAYSFEFSQDNFILIGWVHISMLSIIMASNLFIDLFSQLKRTYDNYLQKKFKQKMEQERKSHFKHLQGFQINNNDL